jgi:exopolysaccharide biosynthesis polyprenyl glycosylphosphotransferase
MMRPRHRWSSGLYLVGDQVALATAFFAAWFLRFEFQIIPLTKNLPEELSFFYGLLLPVVLVLWPVVFYFHGLYQERRDRSRVDEALTTLLAVTLASVLLSGLSAWVRPEGVQRPDGTYEYFTYSRAFLALFAALSVVAVVAARTLIREVLRRRRRAGKGLERILIVGAGALGKEVAQKIQAHKELGYELVGFLDDDPGKAGRSFLDAPVLGALREVDEVLAQEEIDQVVIALPLDAHRKMMRLLREIGHQCVEVKLVPDVLQYATLKASLEDLDGTPVINLSQVPLEGWSSLVKRAMDLVIAASALVVLWPLFLLVALAVWLEDGAPIFYRQERMGLDGKPFLILKFRSMGVHAEAGSGPVWAIRDDPRRTRVGRFLRHWSLDELPQLWNVLVGEMSIVGPRPERPAFVHEFKHKIPQYMVRHRVKAGITGWAQVHGWRGNTSVKKRLQYDLYYIENWSLGLDLKILWMTVATFLYGLRQNAY